MSVCAELEEFVHDHRRHGSLISDATTPAWNGYLLLDWGIPYEIVVVADYGSSRKCDSD